jgi:Arc/MetJ family transcription regulator
VDFMVIRIAACGCYASAFRSDKHIPYVYTTTSIYTLASTMRTNIVIDDVLMRDALKATGLRTKREAVELGLQTLVQLKRQAVIRKFRGKLAWDGDLRESRSLGR